MIQRLIPVCICLFLAAGSFSNADAREFLDALIQVRFSYSISVISAADFIEFERLNFYIVKTTENDGIDITYPSQYSTGIGIFFDVLPLPPLVFSHETQALKLGLRAGYRLTFFRQDLAVLSSDGTSTTTYSGELFQHHAVLFGPVLYWAPSVTVIGLDSRYRAGGGFTLFALCGFVLEDTAKFAAYPAYRNKMTLDKSTDSIAGYETTYTGFKVEAGIGAEISACTLNVGVNIYYSYLNMSFITPVYAMLPQNSELHEFCIEIYVGIPIEIN